MKPRLLILGGTAEARELADRLTRAGVPLIYSLAGRVLAPRLPVGDVRIGGFGGPARLAAWLEENVIVAVLDATHPFAERISASAAVAAAGAGIPLLRLERPGWQPGSGDRWTRVPDLSGAVAAVRESGAERVFLTTGRQGLAAFAAERSAWFLIRCIDPPDAALPQRSEVILDRGPFTFEAELALVDDHRIGVLVTKDSGGTPAAAKLAAARARRLPVIVVSRPPRPAVHTVATIDAAAAWAARQIGQPRIQPADV